MAEEATDVQSTDITPDDFMADEQESPKAEPSPAKTEEKPEAQAEETKDKPEADDTADKSEEPEAKDTDTEAKSEETETEPQKGDKPLAPKSENRFQNLANENRELRQEIERMTSETYAPQTVQELSDIVNPDTGQPYTVAEAADIVINQQQQMRDYTTRAANAQSVLGAEAYEVMQELPMFNPDSDQYDQELAMIGAETLEANLVRDPNIPEIDPETGKPTGRGMVVDYKQSPKQLYKTLARASGISAARGQIKGQQAAEQQLANVDAAGSAAPPKKKADPLAELWEKPL